MSKHLLCPKCGAKLFWHQWYSMSRKYVAYKDGSVGIRSIENSSLCSLEEAHYICDNCCTTYDRCGNGKLEERKKWGS